MIEKISRRKFLQSAAIATAATLLAACTPSATNPPSATATSTPNITLTIISFDPGNVDVNKQIAAKYAALHPNVTVVFNEKDFSTYFSLLSTQIQSGSAPDLFATLGVSSADFGNLVSQGLALPLNNLYDTSRYPKWLLNFYTINGNIYEIPGLFEDTMGVFYHKPVFAKYGLSAPTSQSDFDKICNALIKNGITPIAMPGKSGFDVLMMYDQFIQSYAADWNTNFPFKGSKFTDPAYVDAAKLFVNWADNGYFGKDYSGLDLNSAIIELVQGKAAMFIGGEWNGSSMTGSNDIGGFYLKRPDGQDAGTTSPKQSTGFTIYAKSPNKDAAVEFAKWYSGAEVQQMVNDVNGGIPSTFEAAKGVTVSNPIMQDFAKRNHSELDFADAMGFIQKQATDFLTAMSNNVQQLLYKQITPEQFAAACDTLVDYTKAKDYPSN